MLNVLDLFSGIGGFSLGLERAGMRTVAFCEIEPYPRAVLRKHWPAIPIYDDVRTLTADRLAADGIGPIDVICGGFPCQDVSTAGNGAGIDGARSGLWREYARLICEIRPFWVIVENVAALLNGGICRVLGDLAAVGYDAEWHCIRAARVGLHHSRDRVWIVAYPSESGRGLLQITFDNNTQSPWREADAHTPNLATWDRSEICPPGIIRMADGIPGDMEPRFAALGNAVVPQIPEIIGRAIMTARGVAFAQQEGREC